MVFVKFGNLLKVRWEEGTVTIEIHNSPSPNVPSSRRIKRAEVR